MIDSRRTRRLRTLQGGRAIYDRNGCGYDCVVRDLSAMGARIKFSAPVGLPSRFDLNLNKDQITVPARVAWSNGMEFGVVFSKSSKRAA